MHLSELSFLGFIQIIIFLAEIAFFLFLLLRFRAWHIRVLQAKQGAQRTQDSGNLTGLATFDKEKAEDLLESGLTGIELEKARDSSDAEFLNRQEALLNNLAKLLDVKPASAKTQGGFIMPSASDNLANEGLADDFGDDFDDDFNDNLTDDSSFTKDSQTQSSSFDDISDDFDSSDFGLGEAQEGFESAEDMTDEGFDSFDDFDAIDENGNLKDQAETSDSWDKLDEEDNPKEQSKEEKSLVQKASAYVEDEYNEELQATLDDLEEFDFSDLEKELMKD